MFSIPGFPSFRSDRLRRKEGGVAVHVWSELEAIEGKFNNNITAFELLWIKVRCGIGDVVIGALYHPLRPSYMMELLLDNTELHSTTSL